MDSIRKNLRERFGADRAIVDPDILRAWECDGFTVHKHTPAAVVLPETTEEVAWLLRTLAEQKIAFVPRGAGTCLSGGPTPSVPAVVIETARMKRLLHVDPDERYALVQPGMVNRELSQQVAHLDLHYAPDPSSQAVCTIGGNVAENSGGPHCFKYGMTTDHILGLEVVLAGGEVLELGGPRGCRSGGGLDLVGLFVGSEGTFGIVTQVFVRLSPNPPCIRTLLAAFESMDAACATVSEIVATGLTPAALEILDQGTIRAVEASVYRAGYPQDAAAVLLVELDGAEESVRDDATAVQNLFRRHGALQCEEASETEDRLRLWKGRKGAFGAMGRLRTDLYVLDGVVPRTRLAETLRKIDAIAERHSVLVTNVFHAGDGNLHPNISYDGRDPEETSRVLAAGREILEACLEVGGSITGEHGVGTEKMEFMPMMYGADDLELMASVRTAFDPTGLCNPGKVLPQRASCAEVGRARKETIERVLRAGGSD